jgi:hypothetical protein
MIPQKKVGNDRGHMAQHTRSTLLRPTPTSSSNTNNESLSPCRTRSRIAEDTLSTKSKPFSPASSYRFRWPVPRGWILAPLKNATQGAPLQRQVCRVTGFCLFVFPSRPLSYLFRPLNKADLDGGVFSWATTSSVLWRVLVLARLLVSAL